MVLLPKPWCSSGLWTQKGSLHLKVTQKGMFTFESGAVGEFKLEGSAVGEFMFEGGAEGEFMFECLCVHKDFLRTIFRQYGC